MALTAMLRPGGADLVLFLHGLGCVKENFASLGTSPDLEGLALLAPDLPGHGASQNLPPTSWTMEGMTAAIVDLLEECGAGVEHLHIVVHSLGGAVGLLLAQDSPIPVASFINVEGNLVAADCGMLSRRTAEMDLDQFRNGKFERLKARAREFEDPIVRAWADWMDTCSAESLHASAKSGVAWSDSNRLLKIFLGLRVPKAYVYGSKSANPDVLKHLDGVPKHEISDCGHFVMLERPEALARVIARTVAGSRPDA